MILAALLLSLQTPSKVLIPSWSTLKQYYDYKHLDLSSVHEVVANDATSTTVKISFPGVTGDTVQGLLVLPKTTGRSPVVVLLHGLGGNKESMTSIFGKQLLSRGIGYAAIDAPGHGQRVNETDKKAMQLISGAFMSGKGDLLKAALATDTTGSIEDFLGRAVVKGVIDNRHLLDYVTSRRDVDYNHVTVIGVSMGSIMGAIFGAVDNRVKGLALLVGGDPALPLLSSVKTEQQPMAIAGCCSLYAANYEHRPVLMLNGTHDTIIPRDATDRLYKAFPEPESQKHISWFPSDHFLPATATEEALEWTATQDGKPIH
jgi:predicted esterase